MPARHSRRSFDLRLETIDSFSDSYAAARGKFLVAANAAGATSRGGARFCISERYRWIG